MTTEKKFTQPTDEGIKRALLKRLDGQSLTTRDVQALARHDKQVSSVLLRAVPRVAIRELTGRTQGQLEATARRYGIPLDGAVVDLSVVLPALLAALEADPMSGEGSPALERYRNAKADLAEMDIKVRSGELVPLAEIRQGLMAVAAIYRNGGEALEKACGPVARVQLDAMIDDSLVEIDRLFTHGDTHAD